jgi:predicted transcriptional regulator
MIMVSIQLDPIYQKRLNDLASAQGKDGTELARQILVDYLDFQSLPNDTADDWAEASVALTPEIMPEEHWDESGHGS